MIPLYALVLAGLAGLRAVLAGRAARVERKFVKAAKVADLAAIQAAVRPGNGKSADPLTVARRQYELGKFVQTRDHYGERYVVWQGQADRLGNVLYRLTRAKGRAMPYLLGATDIALVLVALHLLGLPHGLTPDTVRAWAESLAK